jgi:hypothetical protein
MSIQYFFFHSLPLFFWLNALFGGVKHPDPTVADAATKAKRLIRRGFVESGSVTPPFKYPATKVKKTVNKLRFHFFIVDG